MKWEAQGVDRTTGKESAIIVEAPDEPQATNIANYQGLLVESVAPVKPTPALPVLEYGGAKAERTASAHYPGRWRVVTASVISWLLIVVGISFCLNPFIDEKPTQFPFNTPEEVTANSTHMVPGLIINIICGLFFILIAVLIRINSKLRVLCTDASHHIPRAGPDR